MGKEIYHGKLSKIIFNKEKLKECSSDFSFKTKTYNKTVKCIKDKTLAKNLKSEYNNAYLYGLSKIYKNTKDSQLWPVISMSGIVTRDITQFFNKLIYK